LWCCPVLRGGYITASGNVGDHIFAKALVDHLDAVGHIDLTGDHRDDQAHQRDRLGGAFTSLNCDMLGGPPSKSPTEDDLRRAEVANIECY
jgi:hypothetical protein